MAYVSITLEEHGKQYKNYLHQAEISSGIKKEMHRHAFGGMEADQQEALDMIAVKISHILNGTPDYSDNWRDIAGYATLVAERLDGNERE